MTQTFTLTPEQHREFERAGVLRLEGMLPDETVRQARHAVLRPLEARGLWRDGAWRLDAVPRPSWPNSGLKASKVIGNRHSELQAILDDPAVSKVVDELLGGRPYDRSIYPRPQVLFTLPNVDGWMLPSGWHVDAPRLASGERPGVQLFTFLDRVEPRGGGTLVVAGSHRLLNDGRSLTARQIHKLLGPEPFFRLLWRQRTSEWDQGAALPRGAVGEVALEVLELTGEPGDAYLVDLRVLHSGAPNAADRPRMMLTHRFLRADLAREVAEVHGWLGADP